MPDLDVEQPKLSTINKYCDSKILELIVTQRPNKGDKMSIKKDSFKSWNLIYVELSAPYI